MFATFVELALLSITVRFTLSSTLPSATASLTKAHWDQAPLPTTPPTPRSHRNAARFWSTYSQTYGLGASYNCGYITHNPLENLACYDTELCTGFSSAYQCCASSSVSDYNGASVTYGSNCTQYAATACYPLTATESCDAACQSTAIVCRDANYPECFTAVGADNATAMWCEAVSSSVEVFANWFWTWSTSLSDDYSATASTGPLKQTPGSTVAFSISQATEGASTPGAQVTSTSSGLCLTSDGHSTLAMVLLTVMICII